MDVFISWSGDRSEKVARALKQYLPLMIDALEPWISREIERGTRSGEAIAGKLKDSNVGIICLTRDNLDEPLILFEAGAISKTAEGHACTLLLDLTPGDVAPPLGDFQHTAATEEDFIELLKTLNRVVDSVGEKARTEEQLGTVFEKFWPDLEREISEARAMGPGGKKPMRNERDMLEELLEIARELQRGLTAIRGTEEGYPPSRSSVSREKMGRFFDRFFNSSIPDDMINNPFFLRTIRRHDVIEALANVSNQESANEFIKELVDLSRVALEQQKALEEVDGATEEESSDKSGRPKTD